MSGRSPEDLERALTAAERRLAELQAWADASDAEAVTLRAKVLKLEAASSDGKVAELTQWLEASDAEAEKLRSDASAAEARGHAEIVDLKHRLEETTLEKDALRGRMAELEAGGARGASWAGPEAPTLTGQQPRVAAPGVEQLRELQQWLDAAEAESEKLRSRVAELEGNVGATKQTSELQQWLDADEAESEKLRARVAELEAKGTGGNQAAELQQWLDAAEVESEKLREELGKAQEEVGRLKVVQSRRSDEAQAWIDSAQEEAEVLRAKVVEDEKVVEKDEKQVKELQQWLDASEAENEGLREKLAEKAKIADRDERQLKELQEWLDAAEAETEKLKAELALSSPDEGKRLKEKVAELEAAVASLTEMNRRFSDQAESSGQREVERLQSALERAKSEGSSEKTEELSALLENAREAISTLESERRQALAQMQRYAADDSQLAGEQERKALVVQQEREARLAVLQASLGQREGEVKTLEARVLAYAASEKELKDELERLRVRECDAREQLAHVRSERDTLESQKSELTEKVEHLSTKLDETKRWLDASEVENEGLEKKLEAERLERAMREAERAAEAAKPAPPPASRPVAAAPVETEAAEGLEGFSLARLRRLESMLASETARADTLRGYLVVADKSLSLVKDQLELAQARLLDMAKRLGAQDGGDSSDTAQRLADTEKEVVALEKEIAEALGLQAPPPPPLDAFEEVPAAEEEDVLSAPLDAMGALTEAQASATRKATEALEGEQRAKEQLLTDLGWLKTQLAQMSHVRDELKTRLEAMAQRELKRKAVVSSLVQQLRANEAGAAARAGALRRLQAAIELAQRNAVRVQTIYFQKQIGSLQRQLEIALGKKKAPPAGVPKLGGLRAVAPLAPAAPRKGPLNR